MTYKEFLKKISTSNPTDWIYDDAHESYLYTQDISITMQVSQSPERPFEESWAEEYSDPKAKVHTIELLYNGSRISDFYTALVDGFRMCIPYPEREQETNELYITQEQYNIGCIVNIPYTNKEPQRFENYLKEAKIKVK